MYNWYETPGWPMISRWNPFHFDLVTTGSPQEGEGVPRWAAPGACTVPWVHMGDRAARSRVRAPRARPPAHRAARRGGSRAPPRGARGVAGGLPPRGIGSLDDALRGGAPPRPAGGPRGGPRPARSLNPPSRPAPAPTSRARRGGGQRRRVRGASCEALSRVLAGVY